VADAGPLRHAGNAARQWCPRDVVSPLTQGVAVRVSPTSRFFRRATAAGAVAVAIALIPGQAFGASTADSVAKAKVIVDTDQFFDGSNIVLPFGCPDSSTYGQTITIPKKIHKITKFTFEMSGQAAAGQSMVVRGEVYEWNGTTATTPVAESKPMTIAFDNGNFNVVTFKVKGAAVKPGKQYVLFASIDKDYEQCTGNYTVAWGSVDGSLYAGGGFVFQNNTGNEGNWTSGPWNPIPSLDAATKVYGLK
jgi:hypothetical protein